MDFSSKKRIFPVLLLLGLCLNRGVAQNVNAAFNPLQYVDQLIGTSNGGELNDLYIIH